MTTPSKQLSFLTHFNEKKILEETIKSFDEESLKKQVRLQFHKIYELEKMVMKHQEYILSLTDHILSE
jgi:hypothetical protein